MAKKKGLKIDFGETPKEIRRGGGAKHIPEGDYLLKIVEGEVRKSQKEDGGRYINWRLVVAKGPHKGKTIYDITSLKPQSLFNLRNLIHAATGKNVAGKVVNFTPESIYGKIVAATVEDDEYVKSDSDGNETSKMRSRPVDYRPKDELEAEDEEEDDDEEEEEEEEEEEDDLEDVDVEDL